MSPPEREASPEMDSPEMDRPEVDAVLRAAVREIESRAAVVERLVLPPDANGNMPEEPSAAQEYAASHPGRQEVRIVAGATRDGATYCALRPKSHDDAISVVESTDLVPALLQLLLSTLELSLIHI